MPQTRTRSLSSPAVQLSIIHPLSRAGGIHGLDPGRLCSTVAGQIGYHASRRMQVRAVVALGARLLTPYGVNIDQQKIYLPPVTILQGLTGSVGRRFMGDMHNRKQRDVRDKHKVKKNGSIWNRMCRASLFFFFCEK